MSSLVTASIASVYGSSRRRPDSNRWISSVVVYANGPVGSLNQGRVSYQLASDRMDAASSQSRAVLDGQALRALRPTSCDVYQGRSWRSCSSLRGSQPGEHPRHHDTFDCRRITSSGPGLRIVRRAAGMRLAGSTRMLWGSTPRTTTRLVGTRITGVSRLFSGLRRSGLLIGSSAITALRSRIRLVVMRGDLA